MSEEKSIEEIEQEDSELIECNICCKALNGKNFWVVSDLGGEKIEPATICEDCREAIRKGLREQKGWL